MKTVTELQGIQGRKARIVKGPYEGTVVRIIGVTKTFPDFIGDPTYYYAMVSTEWVPEVKQDAHLHAAVVRLRDLELID
jgi:hypothetical protein